MSIFTPSNRLFNKLPNIRILRSNIQARAGSVAWNLNSNILINLLMCWVLGISMFLPGSNCSVAGGKHSVVILLL